jgi:hypothetical protein
MKLEPGVSNSGSVSLIGFITGNGCRILLVAKCNENPLAEKVRRLKI